MPFYDSVLYTPYDSYVIMYLVKKYSFRGLAVKNGGRKAGVLLLVLLAGILIGGVVWQLLLTILPPSLGSVGLTIGTTAAPMTVDLYLVKLTFGIELRITPGSVAGLITGLLLYFWRR